MSREYDLQSSRGDDAEWGNYESMYSEYTPLSQQYDTEYADLMGLSKEYEGISPVDYGTPEFDEKYGVKDFVRVYMNAHTYGMQPHWHKDDGAFTIIYYPTMHWPIEWEGGTIIYGEEHNLESEQDPRYGFPPKDVEFINQYRGNRVLVFDAWRWHSAQQVRRECYEMRPVIVFKTELDGTNRERLDFYK